MCQRMPKAKRSPPYKVVTYVLHMQQRVVNHWLSNLGVELISRWLWRKELYNIFNCLFIASISGTIYHKKIELSVQEFRLEPQKKEKEKPVNSSLILLVVQEPLR